MRYRWVAKTKIKNESSALNDVRWTTNGISLFDFSEFLAATRSFNNKSCKVFRMMSHKSVYLGRRCCRIIITAFLPYVCINVGNKVYLMEEIEKSLLMFLTVWHTTWNHPWRKRMREILISCNVHWMTFTGVDEHFFSIRIWLWKSRSHAFLVKVKKFQQ